jgi:DNA uptake protein ComE-like DNA-binding protein
MDDKRAALLLAGLALAGAGVRFVLAPHQAAAPGDVRLVADAASQSLQQTAQRVAQLARPLLPGERIDVDRADVIELTRLPRVGPALAQRIVAWRAAHGPFGSLARLDSVGGVGPKLLESIRPFVSFSGAPP